MANKEQIKELEELLYKKFREAEYEAVKEFAEKSKKKFKGQGILFYDKEKDCSYYRSIEKEIDELLKEYEE